MLQIYLRQFVRRVYIAITSNDLVRCQPSLQVGYVGWYTANIFTSKCTDFLITCCVFSLYMIRSTFKWTDKKVDRLEHVHSRTSPVSTCSTFTAFFSQPCYGVRTLQNCVSASIHMCTCRYVILYIQICTLGNLLSYRRLLLSLFLI